MVGLESGIAPAPNRAPRPTVVSVPLARPPRAPRLTRTSVERLRGGHRGKRREARVFHRTTDREVVEALPSAISQAQGIVHHVIEMHCGVVSAFSAGKGYGSTFRIILPLMEPLREPQSAVALESKPESPLTAPSKERNQLLYHVRVLVVEDDQDTLDLLKLVLDDSGAEVATAPSVKEAIDVFEHWHPDLLVSDIAMPEQDGYQLIGQIRAHDSGHGGNIPAVALTAYVTTDDKKRALAAGFQEHLTKPIRPEELISALASLAGRAGK